MRSSRVIAGLVLLALVLCGASAYEKCPNCGLGEGVDPCHCGETVVKAAKLQKPGYLASPEAINYALRYQQAGPYGVYGPPIPGYGAPVLPYATPAYAYGSPAYAAASAYGTPAYAAAYGAAAPAYGSANLYLTNALDTESRYEDGDGGKTYEELQHLLYRKPGTPVAPLFKPVGDMCHQDGKGKHYGSSYGNAKGSHKVVGVTPAYPGKTPCKCPSAAPPKVYESSSRTYAPASPYDPLLAGLKAQYAALASSLYSAPKPYGSPPPPAYAAPAYPVPKPVYGPPLAAYPAPKPYASAYPVPTPYAPAYPASYVPAKPAYGPVPTPYAPAKSAYGPAPTLYAAAKPAYGPEPTPYAPTKSAYGPVPTPYAAAKSAYGPEPTSYAPAKSAYGPVPTPYAPAKSAYGPVPSPYAPAKSAYGPVPTPYAPAKSAYGAAPTPYAPAKSAYGPEPTLYAAAKSAYGPEPTLYAAAKSAYGPEPTPYAPVAKPEAYSAPPTAYSSTKTAYSSAAPAYAAAAPAYSAKTAYSTPSNYGQDDDDEALPFAEQEQLYKVQPTLPADPVSISLAYKNFLQTPTARKYVPEDRLAFGHRQQPADGRMYKEIANVAEEKLLTVEKPIVELKSPAKCSSSSYGGYTNRYADDDGYGDLEALERETQEASERARGAYVSYSDLGYGPVSPVKNQFVTKTSNSYAAPAAYAAPATATAAYPAPSVHLPSGPLGPTIPGYKPGAVLVAKKPAKAYAEDHRRGYGYKDDSEEYGSYSSEDATGCSCKGGIVERVKSKCSKHKHERY